MAVNHNELITHQDVKVFAGNTKIGSGQGIVNWELMNPLIQSVCQEFLSLIGRNILADDYTHFFDGHGDELLILNKQFPLNSITNIWIDADREFGSDSLVDSSDYSIAEPKRMYVLRNSGTWDEGLLNIKIEYNAGESETPVDIKQALIEEVIRRAKRRDQLDIASKTTTAGTLVFRDGYSESFLKAVQRYKRKM